MRGGDDISMKIRSDNAKNIRIRRDGVLKANTAPGSGPSSTWVVTKPAGEPDALLSETLFGDAERGELCRGKDGLLRWRARATDSDTTGVPSFIKLPTLAERLKGQAFPAAEAAWPRELAQIVDCLTPIIGEVIQRRLRRPGGRSGLEYVRWPVSVWMFIVRIVWARLSAWPPKKIASSAAWRKELRAAVDRGFRVRPSQQSRSKADVLLVLPRTLPQWQTHNQLWAARVRGTVAKFSLTPAQTDHVYAFASWEFHEGFFSRYAPESRRSPAAFEEFSEVLFFPALRDALGAAFPPRKSSKKAKPFAGGLGPHFAIELRGGLRARFNRLRARHRKSTRKGSVPAHWQIQEPDATMSSDASGILDVNEYEKFRKVEAAGEAGPATAPVHAPTPGAKVPACVETYVEFMKIWRGLPDSLARKERVSRAYDMVAERKGQKRGLLTKRVHDGQKWIERRLGGKP